MRFKRRGARPSARPEATSTVLDGVLRSLNLDDTARGFRAMRAFALAAGPGLRGRARAEKVRGSILFVRVTSSAWAHELHTLKAPLLDKLRRTVGGESIADLRFSVGPLDELPDFTVPPAAPEAPRPAAPAPAPLLPELERAVGQVRDGELRDEISRLLGFLPLR